MAEFPIGTCPSCGGKRIWIDRGFNPYPKWAYIHKPGCVDGFSQQERARARRKQWAEEDQVKEAAEFGACPIHGTERVLDCQPCSEIADRDDWMPDEDTSYWDMEMGGPF